MAGLKLVYCVFLFVHWPYGDGWVGFYAPIRGDATNACGRRRSYQGSVFKFVVLDTGVCSLNVYRWEGPVEVLCKLKDYLCILFFIVMALRPRYLFYIRNDKKVHKN